MAEIRVEEQVLAMERLRMNAEKIIKTMYKEAKDPVVAICFYEKNIEGYRVNELALKYKRVESELRSSMSSLERKLRKNRELRRMNSKKYAV